MSRESRVSDVGSVTSARRGPKRSPFSESRRRDPLLTSTAQHRFGQPLQLRRRRRTSGRGRRNGPPARGSVRRQSANPSSGASAPARRHGPRNFSHRDFDATPKPHQPPRIVELVVRHRLHHVRHAGRQALGTTADAAVMHQRRGVRQQFAERHETEVSHRGAASCGRQLMIVLREQDAAAASRSQASTAAAKKCCASRLADPGENAIGGGPAARNSRTRGGQRTSGANPTAENRPTACSPASRAAADRTNRETGRESNRSNAASAKRSAAPARGPVPAAIR